MNKYKRWYDEYQGLNDIVAIVYCNLYEELQLVKTNPGLPQAVRIPLAAHLKKTLDKIINSTIST